MSAAYLLLEDGTRWDGERAAPAIVGGGESALGEVVFNTAMSGYQEAVTDPSYAGQMIVFTPIFLPIRSLGFLMPLVVLMKMKP